MWAIRDPWSFQRETERERETESEVSLFLTIFKFLLEFGQPLKKRERRNDGGRQAFPGRSSLEPASVNKEKRQTVHVLYYCIKLSDKHQNEPILLKKIACSTFETGVEIKELLLSGSLRVGFYFPLGEYEVLMIIPWYISMSSFLPQSDFLFGWYFKCYWYLLKKKPKSFKVCTFIFIRYVYSRKYTTLH